LSGWSSAALSHKAFVGVVEEGTEAAAVTSVGVEVGSNESPFFIVDRPFVFAIREKSTGVILFIGEIGEVKN